MAKNKTVFVCSDCGSDYGKWQGQCNDCGAWNTLKQLSIGEAGRGGNRSGSRSTARVGYAGEVSRLSVLSEVATAETPRIPSCMGELDRVLGGGMVPGSVILISGNPGAGKSTLLLQVLCRAAGQLKALYVTGEESLAQIAMRGRRLGLPMDHVQAMAETSVERIIDTWREVGPGLCVIDSIQSMYSESADSAPGSVTQVRESAALLIREAKASNAVLILVGHVTKDGSLAGPRVLEHMIDTFIMFDGESDARFRTLRSSKNRYGAVNEVGIFAMTERGLVEVSNPSAIFLSRDQQVPPGSIVMVAWEGTRPLLLEVQALVDESLMGNPRRVSVGFEASRLSMLLAVLHRHGGLQVGDQDVFVNAVGGFRLTETSSDLALLLAIVSSFRNIALPKELICYGEVGLGGEIRPVPNGQERLREAAKHGFKRAIVPRGNAPRKPIPGIEVVGVTSLREALDAVAV
ncbi:MAG: DNA repair protein RadA [Proteobacteria bacterium]|nr:DNA repair protein RadA [Pseudomonadota bacterium]MDA1299452.1 DNA repair protein RadA [Pseudomonadota bacterium]